MTYRMLNAHDVNTLTPEAKNIAARSRSVNAGQAHAIEKTQKIIKTIDETGITDRHSLLQ